MANPGSPQSMAKMQENMPAMPKNTMIGMVLALVVMMVVMMFREQVGKALNVVFQYIGFDGQWPVFTLIIAGLIMITVSTVIRALMTNFVAQAESQHIQSSFNKEMRQARLENNLFKLKKLQEQQPAMMARSMQTSTAMMKIMPVTMIVVLPVYAWVWYFLGNSVPDELLHVALPWGPVDLMGSLWVIPIWIIVYTMISLPIGQLENRIVRYFMLRKRLEELNRIEQKS